MFKLSSLNWIALLTFSIFLIFINYFLNQNQFAETLFSYSVLFLIYIYFVRIRLELSEKTIDFLVLFFHIIPLFAVPTLSPDFYRFIWDGEILTNGIHPYLYTPRELMDKSFFNSNEYLNSIYTNLSDLSKSNYTLYPTVNQLYFLFPSLITENEYAAVIVMKISVLGTCVMGYVYLKKTLKVLKLSTKNILILAVNPLLIIEISGNLHFEGVMLSFLFVAFYFVLTKKWFLSATFWAIAINVKLTPIILLPFLMRYTGWKIAVKHYVLTGVLSLAILSIYLWPTMLPNFMQSLELYFNNFQFNSSFFAITEYLFYPMFDYETILIVGPLLSAISLFLICFIAFFKPIKTGENWFQRMLFGYLIYLLFATTVHPWYIVLPFGLSLFTKNSFMIGWTFLIMLSYGFYALENELLSFILIVIEYSGFLSLLFLDLYAHKRNHFFQQLLKL